MVYYVLNFEKWVFKWPLSEFHEHVLAPLFDTDHPMRGFKQGAFEWNRVQSVREINSYRLLFSYVLRRIDEALPYFINKDFTQKKWTKETYNHLYYILLDSYSFIIFSQIYLNKIARVMQKYLHDGFGDDNFKKWFENAVTISNEDVKGIILSVGDFEFFNRLRDKYSIHHGDIAESFGYRNGNLCFNLESSLTDFPKVYLDIKRLIDYCDQLFEATKKLNSFLVKNIDNIPIRGWK